MTMFIRNNNLTLITICIAMFLVTSGSIDAQVITCSENYEAALIQYNYGSADSTLRILKPCLENKKALNKISNETCVRIFRLAALASIMTGNPVEAETYVKQMLAYQPDYKINLKEGDLMEFGLMLERMNAQPSFRAGLVTGAIIPFVSVKKKYSDYPTPDNSFNLNSSIGYQFGLIAEKAFTKRISVESGAQINRVLFEYISHGTDGVHNKYDQDITLAEIPLIAKYHFRNGRIKPYLAGGLNLKFLLNATEESDDFGKYWFTNSSNTEKILTSFLMDMEHFGLLIGGGASYDLKKYSIRFDLKYNHNFNSSAYSSKFEDIAGYDDIPDTEKFHYTDDINLLSMKNLQISLGFFVNLRYKVY